ncbi:unnamed protein product [Strongylus vulgaris]|uniref:Uncharacterized protein n=1 Tax=Strongylus vulgaris TaxID=40348 RepID=A0A3P7L6V9_STRVU|nr:unnamed protein product [Strongylus vulgaris]
MYLHVVLPMSPNRKTSEETAASEMRSVKEEDLCSESGEMSNHNISSRRESTEHDPKEKQEMFGLGGYTREIRLSSSQQYIADNLRSKPRLGLVDDGEMRTTEEIWERLRNIVHPNKYWVVVYVIDPYEMCLYIIGTGALSTSSDLPFDYPPGCSTTEYCARLTFPADTTSFAEQSSLSLEASLCGLGDFHKSRTHETSADSLDDLRREALRAEIDCARVRMEAASEEKKYWEEKRSLLALERRMTLERHQSKADEEHCRDRLASAAEERMYWEERRRILALKKQCMLEQME